MKQETHSHQDLGYNMVQIIQERRNPSTSQKFGQAFGNMANSISQSYVERLQEKENLANQEARNLQSNEAAKRMGIDLSGIIDPEERKLYIQNALQGQRETGKNKFQEQSQLQKNAFEAEESAKKFERENASKMTKLSEDQKAKIAPLQAGLQTINEMRKLRSKGNLGRLSPIMALGAGETSKDRGAYQTLGNSLISMASTIPIRNKAEFEILTGKLNDPSITDAEAEGVLDSMEKIIQRSMEAFESEHEELSKSKKSNQRPPLSSFQRS